MSPVLAAFPDVEDVVIALLTPLAPTVTVPPPKFTPPLVQITRTGGDDDGITDRPIVTVSCWGDTYPAAKTLAEQCRQRILAAACTAIPVDGYPNGVLIDRTVTDSAPTELAIDDAEKRRKTAVFRFELRRSPA